MLQQYLLLLLLFLSYFVYLSIFANFWQTFSGPFFCSLEYGIYIIIIFFVIMIITYQRTHYILFDFCFGKGEKRT